MNWSSIFPLSFFDHDLRRLWPPEDETLPEQNAGAATTWSYNVDDPIDTITDARGAITTLGYAGTNRKLVTSATHMLPGQPHVTAAFSYDAAGNRTAMIDGLGLVGSQYDQLSRLK